MRTLLHTIHTVISSTADAREFWRVHGVTWHSLIKLHFEIVDRLRANSSLWASSCP
jgi:hypothetical protein